MLVLDQNFRRRHLLQTSSFLDFLDQELLQHHFVDLLLDIELPIHHFHHMD